MSVKTLTMVLYYRRYSDSIVERAYALENITTEQYALILKFHDEDMFIIQGQESVDTLRSVIPNIDQTNYDADRDLYFLHVNEWPYLKIMCLKCAHSNPCLWKYFDEEDNELFEYRMDTFSIFRPPTTLMVDGANSSSHGID